MPKIIYADEDLVVYNKPSGMLCVPGLSDPRNLYDTVRKSYPNARVVHRLDMSTSGMVIFALNYPSQKQLGAMFEKKQIAKRYIAEIFGKLNNHCGEIESPLICDWEKRPKQKIDWINGKRSITQYNVMQSKSDSTRIELVPITGRTHQLRLHMWQIGHPILGDALYNLNGSELRAERLLLHACELNFLHPIRGKPISLRCEPEF